LSNPEQQEREQQEREKQEQERRTAERYDLRLPIEPNGLPATTENMSSSGVYFTCMGDIGVGSEIVFDLMLPPLQPGGELLPARFSAQVVRVESREDGAVGVAAGNLKWLDPADVTQP